MKAAVYERYGAPEVVHLTELPRPTPRAGEVLIKVVSSTVAAGDWRLRRASPFLARLYNGLLRPKKVQVLGFELAGVVQAVGADVAGVSVVVDFAGPGGEVAVVLEALGEGDDVGNGFPEVFLEVVDLGGVRGEAGHEGGAGGAAEGELAVSAVKADAAGGEAVQVRGLDHRVAVAAEGVVHVIGGDEENIGAAGGLRGGGEGGEEELAAVQHTSLWAWMSFWRSAARRRGSLGARSAVSPGSDFR